MIRERVLLRPSWPASTQVGFPPRISVLAPTSVVARACAPVRRRYRNIPKEKETHHVRHPRRPRCVARLLPCLALCYETAQAPQAHCREHVAHGVCSYAEQVADCQQIAQRLAFITEADIRYAEQPSATRSRQSWDQTNDHECSCSARVYVVARDGDPSPGIQPPGPNGQDPSRFGCRLCAANFMPGCGYHYSPDDGLYHPSG